jgi:hypothetical protein
LGCYSVHQDPHHLHAFHHHANHQREPSYLDNKVGVVILDKGDRALRPL